MANPQMDKGFTPIANEILEELVKLRIPASEKDVCYFVIRKTYGFHKKEDRISLTQFEKGTLLSRVTVVKALKNLLSRNILVKVGILFRFNKDHEKWVVKSGLLVKSENIFGKGGYTKSGKGGYTYKRKKIMTKDISEHSSQNEIISLIGEFSKLNPSCKRMYGNNTQRQACEDLIENFGLERVLTVIEKTLPKTNNLQFFPTITTPVQLRDKWIMLESAIRRYQSQNQTKNKVAF
jgi:phage replication O-like protein O